MLQFFIKRCFSILPVLLVVSILAFAFVHLLPGDPARMMAGDDADAATIEMLRDELGLNEQDYTAMILSVSGISVPQFWLGLLLIQFFAVSLKWFPVAGYTGEFSELVLPSLTLGAMVAAIMARFTLSAFLDVLGEEYISTARAKGLSERVVMWKHAFRNALIPVVTMVGLQFGFLLGGSVVVETVFAWPGLGRFMIEAVAVRDYPVLQALLLLYSFHFVFINLVVDMVYALINPEIRYN